MLHKPHAILYTLRKILKDYRFVKRYVVRTVERGARKIRSCYDLATRCCYDRPDQNDVWSKLTHLQNRQWSSKKAILGRLPESSSSQISSSDILSSVTTFYETSHFI